jgi:hypothetical protein
MFYHHVLAWKACYTYFSAVLFKPTSRTQKIVSISSPSSEGGELMSRVRIALPAPDTPPVSISSPSSEGGELERKTCVTTHFNLISVVVVSISSPSSEGGEIIFELLYTPSVFPLVLLQAKAVRDSGILHP